MEALLKGLGSFSIVMLPAFYVAVIAYLQSATIPFVKSVLPKDLPIPAPLAEKLLVADLVVFIVSGFVIYFVYRGVFHRIVWWLQRRVYGIPQSQFHQKMCAGLGIVGPLRERIGISQACLFQLEAIKGSEQYNVGTASFNLGSHFLYLHVVVATLLFFSDGFLWVANRIAVIVFRQGSDWGLPSGVAGGRLVWWVFVAGLLAVLFWWLALAYDRLADYREVVFLSQHQKAYAEVLRNLSTGWPDSLIPEFGGREWWHRFARWTGRSNEQTAERTRRRQTEKSASDCRGREDHRANARLFGERHL